jgi:hypothetical protein
MHAYKFNFTNYVSPQPKMEKTLSGMTISMEKCARFSQHYVRTHEGHKKSRTHGLFPQEAYSLGKRIKQTCEIIIRRTPEPK